jgi:hypothetical protein
MKWIEQEEKVCVSHKQKDIKFKENVKKLKVKFVTHKSSSLWCEALECSRIPHSLKSSHTVE